MINFKGSQFEREVILWGVRWYVAGRHCQLNGSQPDMTTTYCGHDLFKYSILYHFTFS